MKEMMERIPEKGKRTYDLYSGLDLKIASKIQQRRYQLLIHSCIYYKMDQNIISDKKWDQFARELLDLQTRYPIISRNVTLYEYFKDWDASTGAFLPISEPWVIFKAKYLLYLNSHTSSIPLNKRYIDEKINKIKGSKSHDGY